MCRRSRPFAASRRRRPVDRPRAEIEAPSAHEPECPPVIPRILFGIIASLGLLMALGTVLARNLVHAALYLVAFFFLVACTFILLEAEFMAAMQVLVYIGAVAILLLFGIMLTRNIQGDETTAGHWGWKLPGALAALGLFVLLAFGIGTHVGTNGSKAWSDVETRPALVDAQGKPTDRAAVVNDMGRAVGIEMMTRYVVPFEVAGLLLTAALVGAIALAMADGPEEKTRTGAIATVRTGTTVGDGQAEARLIAEDTEALTTTVSAPR